jgi:hypothetical protein
MKQYVLDEPGARPPEATPPSPARRRWRWPTLLAAVGAALLIAGYSLVEGRSEPAPHPIATAVVPAYVAPTVVADPLPAVVAPAPAPALPEALASRVTRADGRYVIDLHAAAIGPALAMLSEATRTTVTGADLVAMSPTRLTTSFVAASPLEAWKGVFGDIASFAMSCGHSSCAVRFVSLVGAGSGSLSSSSLSSTPSSPLQPTLMAPPGAPPLVESGEPMPDN